MNMKNLDIGMQIYIHVIAVVLGACMGSFLNCVAYRLCHGLSIVKGRSRCDSCNHVLGTKDLIPIVSYLMNKGKCRYCGAKLNKRYLISEIVSGVAYFLIVLRFGLSLKTIEYLIVCSLMLCASFADLEDFIIPDGVIALGLLNRFVFCLFDKNFLSELLNSFKNGTIVVVPLLLLVIVMEKILGKEAMGGGDIKLIYMLSGYISLPCSLLSILVACVVGIIFAFVGGKEHEQFPFGPSLCIGYFFSMLVGSSIVSWYISLF